MRWLCLKLWWYLLDCFFLLAWLCESLVRQNWTGQWRRFPSIGFAWDNPWSEDGASLDNTSCSGENKWLYPHWLCESVGVFFSLLTVSEGTVFAEPQSPWACVRYDHNLMKVWHERRQTTCTLPALQGLIDFRCSTGMVWGRMVRLLLPLLPTWLLWTGYSW